ncbi:MAG TPA: shikimate dehydrogenase [Candidatus Methylomirabilis sp.]|nr:shikimate dehydrogenase [Candidatus Methylomirabilis sp.]
MAKASQKNGLFGAGASRICAVAAARTAVEMARFVRMGLRETSTIELRLDWLRGDAEREQFLSWLRRNRPRRAMFLATCRRRAAGGKLAGSAQKELHWLKRAREAGCAWCDLEVETQRGLARHSLRASGLPPRVLLSLHDFKRTPARIAISKAAQVGIAGVKIAANARTIRDSIRLLHLTRRSKNIVPVPMGDLGLPARILALRQGSPLAYAPVGEATAPGQVSLHDLKHLYRAHKLTAHTRVYGVIGDPIGHSLSPLLHNTGFIARRIDAVYLPFLVRDLRGFLNAIPDFGLHGFSVTIPHKQAILRYLDECEPLAAEIGAVNTVIVRRNGSLFGCNTDYVGVLRALEKRMTLQGSRVLIFGAGGSARAAAFALARAGTTVAICARRAKAARELAAAVGGEAISRRALRTHRLDAILNTTPIGMHPHAGASPLRSSELNCNLVMDLIYRPEKTKLLRIAEHKGIATVSGVEMFLAQGFAQWEIWMGWPAPETIMRRAVLRALRAEEKSGPRH